MLFEAAQKPVEAAALIVVVVAGAGLAGMNLAISRYLVIFGEAGLIATSDGYAPSLLRPLAFLFLAFLLVIAAMVVAPLYTRLIIGQAKDNPLGKAFLWPDRVERPRWPSLWAYLAAHGALITLLVYYGVCALWPPLLSPLGLVLVFCLGLTPSALYVFVGPRDGRTGERYFAAVFTAGQLGVFALYWFVSLFILFGDPAAALPPNPSWLDRLQLASTLFLVLLTHWFLTVASTQLRFGVLISVLVTLFVLFSAPGDQLITYNVLRMAGVGGGALKLYRAPGAAPAEAPETACLILAAGDLQVVELTADPTRCEAKVMRARFVKLRDASAAEKAGDLTWVRVLRRDQLVAQLTPADIAAVRAAAAQKARAEAEAKAKAQAKVQTQAKATTSKNASPPKASP